MKYIISLCMSTFTFYMASAQMAVVDVVGNKLNTASLKMQAIEKKTSVASKVILTAMSGDITGSLEALTQQNEILKNSKELRNTLGDVIKTSRIYHEWKNKIKVTKRLFDGTRTAMNDLLENEKLSKETISELNYSLSKIRKLTETSNEMYLAAIDTKDEIGRLTRLEKLQESDNKMELALAELRELEKKINALRKGISLRHEIVNMNLPPLNYQPSLSFNTSQNTLDEKKKKQYFSSIGKGIEKAIADSPYKQFFRLVSSYLNLVFIMIIASVGLYIQRTKGWGNTYGLIKTVFELLLFFTLLKVIIANII